MFQKTNSFGNDSLEIIYSQIDNFLDNQSFEQIDTNQLSIIKEKSPRAVIINLKEINDIQIKKKQLKKWLEKFKERGVGKIALIDSTQQISKKIFYYFNCNIDNLNLKYFHKFSSAEEWIGIRTLYNADSFLESANIVN